jgi:predicted secreted hydrolase
MKSAAMVLVVLLAACHPTSPPTPTTSTSSRAVESAPPSTGLRYLGGPADSRFARVSEPRELSFPRDHGSHDEFRSEWWYFTGNLDSADGRHFGFELTFFRVGLAAASTEPRASAWATKQVWMANFTITDVRGGRFLSAERFARGALGLAGATAPPFRVWLDDWSVTGDADARSAELALRAKDERFAISLALEAAAPVAAHGDRGFDAKGPEPGNASFYYSFPRLSARGSIELDGTSVDVAGTAWMDREWSTSALSAGVLGWAWFGLQLSDGRELMFYRLRQADGTANRYSSGSLIERDGTITRLGVDDVESQPIAYWTSERTHRTYPLAWRIAIPTQGLTLSVQPYLEDQEIDRAVRYWEGAVRVTGSARGAQIDGQGYLELAGY